MAVGSAPGTGALRAPGVRTRHGTATLVSFRNRCFAVTNEHVVAAGGPPGSVPGRLRLLLGAGFPLPPPFFLATRRTPDIPHDLAVIEVDGDAIRHAGGAPIPLEEACGAIHEGDPAWTAGFPGPPSPRPSASPPPSILRGTCRFSGDRRIVLLCPAPPAGRLTHPGGFSGGPILRGDPGGTPILSGIVFSGALSGTGPGGVRPAIWLNAFPFGPALLAGILERCALP